MFHSCQEYRKREYKHLSLITLNNKHFWPKQCESISMKTLTGLKLQMFNSANLSTSMVVISDVAKQTLHVMTTAESLLHTESLMSKAKVTFLYV